MTFHDSDLKVRQLARAMLTGCFHGKDDPRIGKLVASIIYDNSNPEDLRLTAYRALFTIRGMGVDNFIAVHSQRFSFPADVDWSFVNSFMAKDEVGG